jgi:hypothetical protein
MVYFMKYGLLLALSLCCASSLHAQFKSEYRVFNILVEDKPAGTYTQTITTYGEGTTDFVGKSDTKVKVLGITFQHAFRGNERWKEGKLLHLASAVNDNGDAHTLQVNVDKGKLIVKAKGTEREAHLEAWSSSYWTLPAPEVRNKPSYVIDADTGIEYQVTWQNMGKDSFVIGGQRVIATHYRIVGNNLPVTEVWFDENDRLVRRDGVRKGKKVVILLASSEVK